jgi:hypothetical protein
MDRWLRLLLIVLVLAYIPGTPGLGVDTRSADSAPALLGYLYGAAFLAPLLAVAASWKWRAAATWLALLSGILAIVLPGLDELGVLAGPPPVGMVVLNAVVIGIGLAIAWLAWRATRAATNSAQSS